MKLLLLSIWLMHSSELIRQKTQVNQDFSCVGKVTHWHYWGIPKCASFSSFFSTILQPLSSFLFFLNYFLLISFLLYPQLVQSIALNIVCSVLDYAKQCKRENIDYNNILFNTRHCKMLYVISLNSSQIEWVFTLIDQT